MYKYSIGRGNNSIMVRSLFKNRFWWIQSDKAEMEKVNFMWTQIKNAAHVKVGVIAVEQGKLHASVC